MRKRTFVKVLCSVVAVAALCFGLVGCGGGGGDAQQREAGQSLQGKTLKIYCGAGMADPFAEIADAFKQETGCEMEVTYANAAQIQSQIKTTEEGDFFIAGSAEETKPVADYVASSTDLVKHIPVLVVPEGNPAGVKSVADLAKCDKVLVGDPESTPIGKIAKNVMTKAGIWDSMMKADQLTTTTTAPQIATALANGEGEAGIVWKENVPESGVEVIECEQMTNAIKTIPAAQLTCCADADTAAAFLEFLQGDTAKQIWQNYGYELV